MTPTNHETTPPTPNAGEWITHDGGPNPAPGQMVEWENAAGIRSVFLSDDVAGLGKPLGVNTPIVRYRLATPSPSAQDDPAKGLEVVGPLRQSKAAVGEEAWFSVPADDLEALRNAGYRIETFTPHATATRQIAERDARVAELERERDAIAKACQRRIVDWEEAIELHLAAEADAARVRGVLEILRYCDDAAAMRIMARDGLKGASGT